MSSSEHATAQLAVTVTPTIAMALSSIAANSYFESFSYLAASILTVTFLSKDCPRKTKQHLLVGFETTDSQIHCLKSSATGLAKMLRSTTVQATSDSFMAAFQATLGSLSL